MSEPLVQLDIVFRVEYLEILWLWIGRMKIFNLDKKGFSCEVVHRLKPAQKSDKNATKKPIWPNIFINNYNLLSSS
jgi:hypothetical protein